MEVKQYFTMQGDTWDSIAYRLWGEERHMNALLAANADYADVVLFSAGVNVVIPEQPHRKRNSKELPPWLM